VNAAPRREFLAGLAALGAGALAGSEAAAQPAGAKPVRFDFHYHLGDPKYVDVVRAHNLSTPVGMTTERALADMDKAGITLSILSIPGPGVWFGDAVEARRLARQSNEYLAQLVRDHPTRFGFFANLPLPDVEGSLREIEYGLDVLKADGVGLWTSYGDKWLGDPAFAPVFDELNRRKALVYTHPIRPDCCATILPEVPSAVVEYGTDTTRTIASLVFNGVATRCRDMRIIFSHDGGAMPFLIERFLFEARNPKTAQKLPNGVLYELQRFYYETAQAFDAAPMAALLKVVPLAQVLFGTDFPYRDSLEQVIGLRASGVVSDRDIRAIQYDNAIRLVPRLRTIG
jgi:6-methylsalicylate decarboxylase